jgi:hypothetical protein
MVTRLPILILFIALFATETAPSLAQTGSELQLALIGEGSGPYTVPAGQVGQLKMEILNTGPVEVYLVEGDAYLNPDLNGDWQLVHSETMGNFHLHPMQSAIWTFDLAMPGKIQAANVTNGVPQVVLLVKITYSASSNLQQTEQVEFTLNAPGAAVEQSNPIWLSVMGIVAVAGIATFTCIVAWRKRPVP